MSMRAKVFVGAVILATAMANVGLLYLFGVGADGFASNARPKADPIAFVL